MKTLRKVQKKVGFCGENPLMKGEIRNEDTDGRTAEVL